MIKSKGVVTETGRYIGVGVQNYCSMITFNQEHNKVIRKK